MAREWLPRSPPELRSGGGEVELRHATWLELFFDLVFVVAVAELAHELNENLSIVGVGAFVVLLVPTWWAWIGSTFYATRFDSDDLIHRLLTGAEMVAIVALAVNIPHGLGASSAGFALSYAAVRGVLVLKYVRAWYFVPKSRPLVRRYLFGFGLAAGLWFISAFIPPPLQFAFWGVGLLIDFVTPITAGQLHAEVPPHTDHLPERFGLFTIIVLGESIVGVVNGIGEQAWTTASVFTALLSFVIAVSLWWIYFDNLEGTAIQAARGEKRVLVYEGWLYAHLPLVIGLAAAGTAVNRVLVRNPEIPLPAAERWLLCGAVALSFVSIGAIQWTSFAIDHYSRNKVAISRLASGIGVLLVALVGGGLSPVVVTGLVAVACAVQVIFDVHIHHSEQKTVPTEA